MIHAAHAHVLHGERRARAQRRDGRGHPHARCECGARRAGTINRFRDERERLVLGRSEEHTSELQSLMRISYAVFCLKKKNEQNQSIHSHITSITLYISIKTNM